MTVLRKLGIRKRRRGEALPTFLYDYIKPPVWDPAAGVNGFGTITIEDETTYIWNRGQVEIFERLVVLYRDGSPVGNYTMDPETPIVIDLSEDGIYTFRYAHYVVYKGVTIYANGGFYDPGFSVQILNLNFQTIQDPVIDIATGGEYGRITIPADDTTLYTWSGGAYTSLTQTVTVYRENKDAVVAAVGAPIVMTPGAPYELDLVQSGVYTFGYSAEIVADGVTYTAGPPPGENMTNDEYLTPASLMTLAPVGTPNQYPAPSVSGVDTGISLGIHPSTGFTVSYADNGPRGTRIWHWNATRDTIYFGDGDYTSTPFASLVLPSAGVYEITHRYSETNAVGNNVDLQTASNTTSIDLTTPTATITAVTNPATVSGGDVELPALSEITYTTNTFDYTSATTEVVAVITDSLAGASEQTLSGTRIAIPSLPPDTYTVSYLVRITTSFEVVQTSPFADPSGPLTVNGMTSPIADWPNGAPTEPVSTWFADNFNAGASTFTGTINVDGNIDITGNTNNVVFSNTIFPTDTFVCRVGFFTDDASAVAGRQVQVNPIYGNTTSDHGYFTVDFGNNVIRYMFAPGQQTPMTTLPGIFVTPHVLEIYQTSADLTYTIYDGTGGVVETVTITPPFRPVTAAGVRTRNYFYPTGGNTYTVTEMNLAIPA